ncbi:MAG TPA: XrtA/PEP-CTERM system histidine kinase PrsK, partial [bacterium]
MTETVLPRLAALLLLALCGTVLLKESRLGRVALASGLLLLALVELFDSQALRDAEHLLDYKRFVLVCKSLIPIAFLLYGMSFTKRAGGSRAAAAAPLLVIAAIMCGGALLLPIEQFYAGYDFSHGRLLVLGSIGYWFYLGLMIFCIAALVNVELVFGGVRGADRGRLRYEFLGVGAILAVMIFYFSQGLLYRAVNMDLLPARSVVLAVAALLIGYSRLYQGRTASLAVSRQALYRSVTLVAVGLYLLALGVFGVGMKRLDLSVTPDVSVLVAVLSGLLFLALLLSEEIRRRAKLLLARHFYAQKHDYREEWLGFSNALAGCRSLGDVRTAIVDRYRQTFGLRFAALYERTGGSDSFALAEAQGRTDLPARATFSDGLLGYFSETARVMNPADGEYTPTAAETVFMEGAEAWLLVPLMSEERLEAFVVFGAQVVPETLTYEDFDLMKIMGRQAVLSLKNFQLAEELTEAREMAAVAKVSSFVIHDLKNLAYTFSLMMENADEHIREPEFQDDLVTSIHGTVAKMNALIAKLKAFPEKRELAVEAADLAQIGRDSLAEVSSLKRGIAFESYCAAAASRMDVPEIRKVALNLLLNACDAVGGSGTIKMSTGRRGAEAFLRVEDNGCGMSPAFIQGHLFKPFRTTKEKGLGIGLYQCRQIVEAHEGRIEVDSREG